MSRFTRFSWGKIWFDDIGPCKRFDILQLWLHLTSNSALRIKGGRIPLGSHHHTLWRRTEGLLFIMMTKISNISKVGRYLTIQRNSDAGSDSDLDFAEIVLDSVPASSPTTEVSLKIALTRIRVLSEENPNSKVRIRLDCKCLSDENSNWEVRQAFGCRGERMSSSTQKIIHLFWLDRRLLQKQVGWETWLVLTSQVPQLYCIPK